MALEHYKTQVLLLHSQQSTLDVLSSGFNDRYAVHCATSGTEALNTMHDTPIHVIIFAQDLPGMSGLEALREARKRSPDTIGILLAGSDHEDGLEALVGDKEVFEIVRGKVEPSALIELIDSATKRVRLMAISESANDQEADVDVPAAEHIVMETSEFGATIISDGTGTMPALRPEKVEVAPGVGARGIDVLVLTKDEEFLATIKDSARGLHNIHHSVTPTQAEEVVKKNKVGVLVTDAAMVGSDIESLTQKLRTSIPRLVAIVAGRRDDGEMLMDLINRGHVYRFLLKPVSPGRSRLAIEASVKHHLEAPDTAFKSKPKVASASPAPRYVAAPKAKPKPAPKPVTRLTPKPVAKPQPVAKPMPKPVPKATGMPAQKITPTISDSPLDDLPLDVSMDSAFGDDKSFTDTMTDIAEIVGKSISGVTSSAAGSAQDIAKSSGAAVAGLANKVKGPMGKPKMLAAAGGAVALIALAGWIVTSWESSPDDLVADSNSADPAAPISRVVTPPPSRPRTTEQQARTNNEVAATEPRQAPAVTQPVAVEISREWQEARDARDAGRLILPAGDNAIELYLDALSRSPSDASIQTELGDVVGQVLGLAESAMLSGNAEEAANALNLVELADADNPRLTFLSAQLAQLQLRDTAAQARIAIRNEQFEDAATLIAKAQLLAGSNSVEATLLQQEMTAALNAQQAGEFITFANERLEAGDLTTPANDNAQYFFEQALEVDAGNQAAKQGLIAVASKIVLQARESIDAGQLDNAESLLSDARNLDPASAALGATAVALTDAREAIAEAARIAELERLAEIERQAEAARKAEAERLAEIERKAEAERQAELARQAELERQAELQRQAELERQRQAQREAEAARQAEIERQAELRRQADLQAEQNRLAEIARQEEVERQAAAAKQAEIDRVLEQQRQAESSEAARILAEQNAAKAATSSPLGVGGSSTARTTVPSAGSQTVASSGSAPVKSEPAPRTVTPTTSSTTGNNAPSASTSAAPERTTIASSNTQSAPSRAAPQQAQQASVINGTALGTTTVAAMANAAAKEPEVLPVSRLTRVNYVAPEYPRGARRRNITGSVDLIFTVTTDGKVRSPEVIRSEPTETFDDAALKAINQWRFEPYIENGVAVEKRTAVRLAFNLQE